MYSRLRVREFCSELLMNSLPVLPWLHFILPWHALPQVMTFGAVTSKKFCLFRKWSKWPCRLDFLVLRAMCSHYFFFRWSRNCNRRQRRLDFRLLVCNFPSIYCAYTLAVYFLVFNFSASSLFAPVTSAAGMFTTPNTLEQKVPTHFEHERE